MGKQGDRIHSVALLPLIALESFRNTIDLPIGPYSFALERIAQESGVPWVNLGIAEGGRFLVPGLVDIALAELAQAWHTGLEHALRQCSLREPSPLST